MPREPDIIDSHCHLDFPDFNGELPAIIARAQAAGVTQMVTICTRLKNITQVRMIAEKYDPVFFAAGAHPMHVEQEPMTDLGTLLSIAQHPKMVGIGETGLDYHYSKDSADQQKQSLEIHIEAARQSNLPLIIHARAADTDIAQILEREYKAGPFSCVMHCFSSSAALAETALDLGFYLSMSGIATFKNSADLRAIFATAPVEQLLLETDAPYLAPTPHRGKRNEPAFTTFTGRVGAELHQMDYADFAAQTTANFTRLFKKTAQWQAES